MLSRCCRSKLQRCNETFIELCCSLLTGRYVHLIANCSVHKTVVVLVVVAAVQKQRIYVRCRRWCDDTAAAAAASTPIRNHSQLRQSDDSTLPTGLENIVIFSKISKISDIFERKYRIYIGYVSMIYSVSQKKVAPLKLFAVLSLLVNLCNWKLPWLLPKHIPMSTPILVHLSEYLCKRYHFYRCDPSNFIQFSLLRNSWIFRKNKSHIKWHLIKYNN